MTIPVPDNEEERLRVLHELHVLDTPSDPAITKALLQKFGFADVQDASDGASALDLLRGSTFSLVISDLLMAPMSGLDLFRAMRADRRLRTVPFIMLTANLNHDTVLASKQAGIEHYLIKPFRLGALHEKLVGSSRRMKRPHRVFQSDARRSADEPKERSDLSPLARPGCRWPEQERCRIRTSGPRDEPYARASVFRELSPDAAVAITVGSRPAAIGTR